MEEELLLLAALERSVWPLSPYQTDAALVTVAAVVVCLFHPPLRAIDAREPLTMCPDVDTFALRACRSQAERPARQQGVRSLTGTP